MVKKLLIYVFLMIALLSCNNKPDLYLTTTGAYASNAGGFIAAFPSKPNITVQENVIGDLKFNTYLFRKTSGPSSLFSVAYLDYPLNVLEKWEDKNILFEQMVLSMSKSVDDFQVLKKEMISSKGVQGINFELGSNVHNGYGKGKVLLRGNRLYIVMFVGVGNIPYKNQIDKFVDEFKLSKINEA